ncbi:MAG TPA: alpha/beta hydrolase family protein [Vicinamibacterales bacterium]
MTCSPIVTRLFHRWERRLAAVSDGDRVVRPFDWGSDWLPPNGHGPTPQPEESIQKWVREVLQDSRRFFDATQTTAYRFVANGWDGDGLLTFPSALETPHPINNVVHARYIPARGPLGRAPKRAVVVLPQWNSDETGHVGLSRILAHAGISALRLTLPYHDRRMPPELSRADYIVSSNVTRTLQVCRQAVLDARRAIAWLADRGYERIGILGTSLGSCLAMLTAAHEPLIRAQALNHISPYFADVVWEGLSTAHVRAGLEGHIELNHLRSLWLPISPQQYLDQVRSKKTLLVYARYDLTFPVSLSQALVNEFRRRDIPHEVAVLPCGHYSTGRAPFKFVDAWVLTRFLRRSL